MHFAHKGIESLPQNKNFLIPIFVKFDVVDDLYNLKFYIIWSNRVYNSKHLRSATLGYKDIWIRNSGFVAKIQFLYAVYEIRDEVD